MRITAISAACLALVGISIASDVEAAIRRTTTIYPQGLAPALETLAKERDFQILYVTSVVGGVRTDGAVGEFTDAEAIEKLLSGTRLTYRYVDEKTVMVISAVADTENRLDAKQEQREVFIDRSARAAEPVKQSDQQSETTGATPSAIQAREQSAEDELHVVIVTGTHLRRDFEPISPVLVIDADQIERTGYSSTEHLLESLPQNFGGGQAGASADGVFGSGADRFLNYSAGTGVNLRGLGTSSTLVLINGHRVAPTGFGTFVDVSSIPLSAIERVEVLTDGSSAIYGSDAVGGVVNILLKDEYEGLEAGIRYGSVTDGSRDEQLYSLSAGSNWNSGSVVVGAQVQSFDPLYTDERDFSADVPRPATLLPESEMRSLNFSIKQAMGDSIRLSGFALYSDRDVETVESTAFNVITAVVDQEDLNAAIALDYQPSERWSLSLSGAHGRQRLRKDSERVVDGGEVFTILENALFETTTVDLLANIDLWTTRAGTVVLAAGGSSRQEDLDTRSTNLDAPEVHTRNRVTSVFGEMRVPLVGADQSVPGVEKLELSLAARRDDYSQFGAESTPFYGVRWAINDAWSVRATYGESYRAPNALEYFNSQIQPILFATGPLFTDPDGAIVPMILMFGSRPLTPERARTLSFGLDVVPADDWVLSINYYDIDYDDRIVTPPFDLGVLLNLDTFGSLVTNFADEASAQAFLEQLVDQGALFVDLTPEDGGAGDVRYFYDLRQQNAALLRQKGIDFTASYAREIEFGSLSLTANATYIDSIITSFAGATQTLDQVDTTGNPTNLRARFDVGLDIGSTWSINTGVNYVDKYTNTSQAEDIPVDSWMTVDVMAAFYPGERFSSNALSNSTITLSVQNVLDESPPVVNSGLPETVQYDPANASPLGRFVAIEFKKAW